MCESVKALAVVTGVSAEYCLNTFAMSSAMRIPVRGKRLHSRVARARHRDVSAARTERPRAKTWAATVPAAGLLAQISEDA